MFVGDATHPYTRHKRVQTLVVVVAFLLLFASLRYPISLTPLYPQGTISPQGVISVKKWLAVLVLTLFFAACGEGVEYAPYAPYEPAEMGVVADDPVYDEAPPAEEPPLPEAVIKPDVVITLSHAPAVRTFDLTALEMARAMGVGWNVGNSMDAFTNRRASETAWNNARIQPELFQVIRAAGFTNVRIPVTWVGHIDDADNFAVSEAWMNRVEEVVNYALDADLYVVINIHHDGNNYFNGGAWLSIEEYPDGLHPNWFGANAPTAAPPVQEEVRARFAAVWEQIALRFRDYDARLLFEGFNELRELGNYGNPVHNSSMQNLNYLNQLFVDTVRATGGNNAYRFLIVAGYNTNANITLSAARGFAMPTDTVPYRLMLSIHFYDPWYFTLNTGNRTVYKWGQELQRIGAPGVDSWGHENHVRSIFGRLYDTFVSQGIPIYMGEYGAHSKFNVDVINHEYRRFWLEYITRAMIDYGMVPVYWDNGNATGGGERFSVVNRNAPEIRYDDLVFAMVRAPYAPARPLFSRQLFNDTFGAYADDPQVRALLDAALLASDAYRGNISLETLAAVEDAWRGLWEVTNG